MTRMRHILLLISFSNHKLFTNEFIILRDFYKKIINEYSLPVTVWGYKGGDEYPHVDYDTSTICLGSSDRDISAKFHEAQHIIINTDLVCNDYDVIINTNASTIVNIFMLNQLIQDDRFDMDSVYGIPIPSSEGFIYPEGKMFIYSKNIQHKVFDIWDKYVEPTFYGDDYPYSDVIWGTCEDAVFGTCCHVLGIKIHNINNRLCSRVKNLPFWDIDYDYAGNFRHIHDFSNVHELSNTCMMNVKLTDDKDKVNWSIRESFECDFLYLMCIIYNRHYTDRDIRWFLDTFYQE